MVGLSVTRPEHSGARIHTQVSLRPEPLPASLKHSFVISPTESYGFFKNFINVKSPFPKDT